MAHASEIFHMNEDFYIDGCSSFILTVIYNLHRSWMMAALFLLAGFVTMFSVSKRGIGRFYTERIKKLLLPFCVGLVTVLPLNAFVTMKAHNIPVHSIADVYTSFFTKVSLDFYGYDGGLTPAHLWFILYLFIFALLSYPLIRLKLSNRLSGYKFRMWHLVLLTILIYVSSYGTSDESPVKYLLIYLFGIIASGDESFVEKIQKTGTSFLITGTVLNVITSVWMTRMYSLSIWTAEYVIMHMVWAFSCTLLVFGFMGVFSRYFDAHGNVMKRLSRDSFGIYYIHMSFVIIIGFFIVRYVLVPVMMQWVLIIIGAVICTFFLICILRYVPGINKFLHLSK